MKDAFIKACDAPDGAVCLCGDSDCGVLTAAFAAMQDARKRFVELSSLPIHRQAYLRHLLPNYSTDKDLCSQYIALHHFHPQILAQQSHKIPKTLSLGQGVQLRMPWNEKDKVTDENGMQAFIFCPNYPKEKIIIDVENLTPETIIQVTEEDSCENDDSDDDTEVFEIPESVELDHDELSDVSSIEFVLDEEKDAVTLKTPVPAKLVYQVSWSMNVHVSMSC